MMKKISLWFCFCLGIVLWASSAGALGKGEAGAGLKEALILGAKNAALQASQLDGFYKNPLIFIPFPPQAKQMEEILIGLGLKSQVQKFVLTLNRAAEEAAKQAAPIFIQAIKELTIQDAFQILKGPNDAATIYLKNKTSGQLQQAFLPIVQKAIDKVEVTRYWTPLVKQYNHIPLVKKVNPKLDDYVTDRAISGLFKLIANEEAKIRKNPAARVTDLLRRVFGS
jgi:uncharacterized protein DUF4197